MLHASVSLLLVTLPAHESLSNLSCVGPKEHVKFRAHIKEHERTDLDRVSITMPGVGKGGPGLKKKVLYNM